MISLKTVFKWERQEVTLRWRELKVVGIFAKDAGLPRPREEVVAEPGVGEGGSKGKEEGRGKGKGTGKEDNNQKKQREVDGFFMASSWLIVMQERCGNVHKVPSPGRVVFGASGLYLRVLLGGRQSALLLL